MKKYFSNSRRKFVKQVASSSASLTAYAGVSNIIFDKAKPDDKKINANDTIQVGAIGLGIMGFNNCNTLLKIPGTKLISACDLYAGRLKRGKEVFGESLKTTNNYKEILSDPSIDAVIVSTTDHWHDKISIDAMKAGKAVYCEKPMVHHIEEGHQVIKTQNETKSVFQVGSQRVSSKVYLKAKELFEAGHIGDLNMAEIWYDRQSALGAWQYSIPRDASPASVAWDQFLGDAPKIPFDPNHFFRWRNYQAYGTGVAGDLFVHLFSGLHLITSSKGPERIFATGGLRYWKDGRDVPDIIIGSYDYPETKAHPAFNVQMRVNFVHGGGGGSKIRLIGSKGVMTIGNAGIDIKYSIMPEAPGYGGWDSFNTFDKTNQKEFEKWYKETHPKSARKKAKADYNFKTPPGYSDHVDHFQHFVDGIKNGKEIVEDATFGLRAAGPALASNKSYFEKQIVKWDPVEMKVIA